MKKTMIKDHSKSSAKRDQTAQLNAVLGALEKKVQGPSKLGKGTCRRFIYCI